MSAKATTDLCDTHGERVAVAEPIFRDFGARLSFDGAVATAKVFEDNTLVREALSEPGQGRVLVVDGGGSTRCALLGDRLAAMAIDHGWSGIVVFGCVRDSAELAQMDLGIKALAAHPRKSEKRGEGQREVPVAFAGIVFAPGAHLYADKDGVIVMAP